MLVALKTTFWRFRGFLKPGKSSVGELSPEILSYLSRDNPALENLKNRYAKATNLPHSFWVSWENKVNLLKFRGEDDYVSQAYFVNTDRRYEMTCAYVEMADDLGLLNVLREDRLFGVKTWEFIPGMPVSRDLMDSILEITFLQKALGFGQNDHLRVLDIGAGYGRFAHRFAAAFPKSSITCIDAVATSTFLSDFYLKFRGCKQATVVPFDRIGDLRRGSFDVAANIHSWSECSIEFIIWWLDRLYDLKVPYLFLVPHTESLTSYEVDSSRKPYDNELKKRGFKLLLKQRKFHRSKCVDKDGVFPTDYLLYKRKVK